MRREMGEGAALFRVWRVGLVAGAMQQEGDCMAMEKRAEQACRLSTDAHSAEGNRTCVVARVVVWGGGALRWGCVREDGGKGGRVAGMVVCGVWWCWWEWQMVRLWAWRRLFMAHEQCGVWWWWWLTKDW